MPLTTIPYINAVALESDVNQFLPGIKWAVSLIPGVGGNMIMNVVDALANPAFLVPVVELINQISGAQPPTTTTK